MNLIDVAYGIGLTAASPILTWRWLRHGKYRESLPGSFGTSAKGQPASDWPDGCLWVHAVSVGEVGAARAILPHLREAFPGRPVLVTTVTETGQATARRQLGDLADAIAYWPADFSPVVRRFLDRWRPGMLVIMETELWPNALSLTAARGIPVFTMNSKISRRSFPRYQKLLWLLGPALRCVRGWCVQTEDDARRVATLTGHAWPSLEGPIQVTGNVKFDLTLDAPDTAAIGQLREKLGLAQGDRLVVVGSTHPGEEESILGALGPVIAARRNTVLALVPRHPERFGEAWSIISRMGAEARRLSDEATTAGGPSAPRVVLVDAMGLLVRLYAACDVAIVAGSFSGLVGGHNVLEPAVFAKPVIFGMDMRGQPEMAQVLRDGDGCVQCPIQTLGAEVARLLDNPLEAAALGERAKRAVDTNRGAARRSVEQVLHWINAMPLPAPTIS